MFIFLEKALSWRPFAKASSGRRRGDRSRRESRASGFQGERPPVPRREVVIAVLAGTNLALLPWLVAGQPLWAQRISLVFSALAFAFLFLPVGYDEWRSANPRRSWESLVRCVPFWCGLFLTALFALQGMNPRFTVELDGGVWQLLPESYVKWMPAGVDAPIWTPGEPGGMNAWRTAMIFAPAWLTFSALWTGVRSRRVTLWLVRAVLFSCVALAVFAMGMRAAGDGLLYGKISVGLGSFYGPFSYQNQGGAFFYLAFLLASALALREWRTASGPVSRGGAHFVISAMACLLAGAAVYSASFAGFMGVVAGVAVLLPALLFVRLGRGETEGRSWIGAFVAFALVAGLCAAVFLFSDIEPVWQKLTQKFNLIHAAKVDDRAGIRAATWMLFKDSSPWFGSGAGSYRWISPEYFVRIPEFRSATTGALLSRANYAHCDWLQMLAEWGVVGVMPLLVGAGWWLRNLWTGRILAKPVVWPVTAALLIVAGHASGDYLFFNPAVCLLTAFLAFVSQSWLREAKI